MRDHAVRITPEICVASERSRLPETTQDVDLELNPDRMTSAHQGCVFCHILATGLFNRCIPASISGN
jgi:hypothetical protein